MANRLKANWLAVRAYYASGHDATECAVKFGVSKRQVERHASDEGWKAERHSNVVDATLKLRERQIADTANEVLDHEKFLAWSTAIIKDSEHDLLEITSPRSRIEARRAITEMVERGLKMSRLVRGLRDGVPSVATEVNVTPGKTYEVVVIEAETA